MLDEPTSLAGRRHLIDGGYALLLLAIAIVAGYLILAPSDLVATPLARPLPEPRTGLLIDRSRPAEPMRARQSWPKMVTGKILDGDRQPLEGASIVLDSREYRTGSDGTFEFEGARAFRALRPSRPLESDCTRAVLSLSPVSGDPGKSATARTPRAHRGWSESARATSQCT